MKKQTVKPLVFVGCLIAVTCATLAYSSRSQSSPPPSETPPPVSAKSGILTLTGALSQDKIFTGGDGLANLALTLTADDVFEKKSAETRHVDMVIVLDRSGSMEGEKIGNARKAVLNLLADLSPSDRFALVSYSSSVRRHFDLLPVTDENRIRMMTEVSRIMPGGGTNLGSGLAEGIGILARSEKTGNPGRVILISDGLANEGITDPIQLGKMAASALKKEFAVSTVGVGTDFNEHLMTLLADRGTGSYYFLENPTAFARVFRNEFQSARTAVATHLEIRVPLPDGVTLTGAAGYPIEIGKGFGVFYPGDLRSGETRKFFLTFRLPTGKENRFEISGIRTGYKYQNQAFSATIDAPLVIACVNDPNAALSSIRRDTWEQQVIQDDFNELKGRVAADIASGRKEAALGKIRQYSEAKKALNDVVKSEKVAENLDKDVTELETMVEETFAGDHAEVQSKQKRNSKVLQFEGYQGLRYKK